MPRKKFPLWAVVVGGVLLVGCAVGVAFVGMAYLSVRQEREQFGTVGATPIPREDFRKHIHGKTQDEVIAVVGKPDSTGDSDGLISWKYFSRTFDPITGKTDYSVLIFFRNGRVDSVTY